MTAPVPPASIQLAAPLRQRCLGCGGSCQSVYVRATTDEASGVARMAEELGIPDAIHDGLLRSEKGRCVFLDPQNLCRIHGRYGAEAKPLICRQYPYILLEAEDGLRAGIDPGCYMLFRTRREAPPLHVPRALPRATTLPPQEKAQEDFLLDLLSVEGIDLASIASALAMVHPSSDGSLPTGWAMRWITHLQDLDLEQLLHLHDTSPVMREALRPLSLAMRFWDAQNPPPWPVLGPDEEALAVQAIVNMVFLRLHGTVPGLMAVAQLALGGAVACAWTDPSPEAFGPALAAWCRVQRARPFWQPILPDPAALIHLATGR